MILFSRSMLGPLVGKRKEQGDHGRRGRGGRILGPKVTAMNQEMPLSPVLFPGSWVPGNQTSLPYQKEKSGGPSLDN